MKLGTLIRRFSFGDGLEGTSGAYLIETPKSMNPGMDITAIPGTVHIYIDPPVDTSAWTIEGLDGYPRAFEENTKRSRRGGRLDHESRF